MLPFITKLSKRDRGRLSRKIQGSKDWLEDFKMVMAFVLFATVIYLLYIMEGVLGGKAVIWALGFLVGVGFAAWLWGRLVNIGKKWVALAWISAIVIVALTGWFTVPRIYASQHPIEDPGIVQGHEGWEKFSVASLQQYTAEGKTVLVDFTADWCPNCKTNEAVALNIPATMELKEELGIIFMIADWTARDEEIGSTLRALGFASVPLTAVFPGDNPNEPILLDGLFSASRIQDVMREAASGSPAPSGVAAEEPAGDDVAIDLADLDRADLFLESRYAVLLDPLKDREVFSPGDEFTLGLRLTPFENDHIKFHIYGSEPSEDFSYIPTVMVMDEAEGVTWGDIVFPPGVWEHEQMWLTGQPVVFVTGKLADDAAAGAKDFTAKIMFSACTDNMCLVPSELEVRWEIDVADDGTGEATDPLSWKTPVSVDLSRYSLPESGELGGGLAL